MRQKSTKPKPPENVEPLRRLIEGSFEFHDQIVISKESRFGDSTWNLYDPANERFRSYQKYRLLIDWNKLKKRFNLPGSIITDLKRYAVLRLFYSREVFCRFRRCKNPHPAVLEAEIKILAHFLAHMRRQTEEKNFNLIHSLSDIEVEDIENGLSTYARAQQQRLKQALAFLCDSSFSNLLKCGPLKWNRHDLKNLPWNLERREPYKRVDEKLFRFLSNAASADVKQFLQAINIQPIDGTKLGSETNLYLSSIKSFGEFFEEYCTNRTAYIARNLGAADHKYVSWCNRQKGVIHMHNLVDRARRAAQIVIILYLGARLSEFNSFRKGCLHQDGDQWIIKGTEVKRRGLWAPVLDDQWIAIPIVRDAIRVLEETAPIVGTEFLFHSDRHYRNRSDQAPTSNWYSVMFSVYLKYVDPQNEWNKPHLHLYQFRHTLVFQLRKAGLGLPFITFQLKHYYDALNRTLNDVTLGYGTLNSFAARQAVEDANKIFIEQLYHPDSPVAGGGAELHKARRAAYFKGMALQGVGTDEALANLAKQNIPLTDVGTALCTGQRKIVIDGIKNDPPCIGSLRCNPIRCTNALIPDFKLPAWERVALENDRRAEDPEFAHARSYHQEASAEAKAVIQYIQIQRRQKQ